MGVDLENINAFDGRRLEMVADGLNLWQKTSLAINTAMVSALRRNRSANMELPIRTALHSIERTSPDLSREKGTCPVVYVGGRGWRKRNSKMSLLKTTNIHSVDRSRNAPKIGQKRKNRALDAVECHLGLRRFSGVHSFIAKPLSCIRQKRCSFRGRSVENVLRDCLRLF